jgi:hypothetical protein
MKTKLSIIIAIATIVVLSSCSESESNEMRMAEMVNFTFWSEAQTTSCVNGSVLVYVLGKTPAENELIKTVKIDCAETGTISVDVPKSSWVKVVFDSKQDVTYVTYVKVPGGTEKIYSTHEGITYKVQ